MEDFLCKQFFINAWPITIASKHNPYYEKVNKLKQLFLELLINSTSVNEFIEWLKQADKAFDFELPSNKEILISIFGVHLYEVMNFLLTLLKEGDRDRLEEIFLDDIDDENSLLYEIKVQLGLNEDNLHERDTFIISNDIKEKAQELCNRFNLGGINIWASELESAEDILHEIETSFGILQNVSSIESNHIGDAELFITICAGEFSPIVSEKEIFFPNQDIKIAAPWFKWKLSKTFIEKTDLIYKIKDIWIKALKTEVRGKLYRKKMFFNMALQSFITAKNNLYIHPSSDLVERRTDFLKKLIDIIFNYDFDEDKLIQAWEKLKAGNNITWKSLAHTIKEFDIDASKGDFLEIKRLTQEDLMINQVIYKKYNFDLPAWLYRYINQNNLQLNINLLSNDEIFDIWSLGFEKILLEKDEDFAEDITNSNVNHPVDLEFEQFKYFFEQHLQKVIY